MVNQILLSPYHSTLYPKILVGPMHYSLSLVTAKLQPRRKKAVLALTNGRRL